METVKIYGASDDLIEVEGSVREEFSANDEQNYLAFSDGTLLSVRYDREGFWRINRLREGSAAYDKREGADADHDYSDVVTLTAERFEFVLHGTSKGQRR